MNRRTFVMVVTVGLAALQLRAGEMLKNPGVSKDLNYWICRTHHGYVPKPNVTLQKGVFMASGCSPLTNYYLSLMQVVNIRKGRRYKLSYEIRGKGGGTYRAICGQTVGHHKDKLHLALNNKKVTDSWETVEAEFVGKFDTDAKWVRKLQRACRNHKLKNGNAMSKEARSTEGANKESPNHSTLMFLMGSLEGEFAIRNISLVELE